MIDVNAQRKLVAKLKQRFYRAMLMAPSNFYVAGMANVVVIHPDQLAKI
jgi:hypothetical protein